MKNIKLAAAVALSTLAISSAVSAAPLTDWDDVTFSNWATGSDDIDLTDASTDVGSFETELGETFNNHKVGIEALDTNIDELAVELADFSTNVFNDLTAIEAAVEALAVIDFAAFEVDVDG